VNNPGSTVDNAALPVADMPFHQKREMRYLLSLSVSGAKVYGKIMLPAHASATSQVPGAVLCHGFGADQAVMESSASLLVAKGIAAIVFDMHGHGSSEGL
jgi:cephalosporin-C deacetylase-like acetyl esterase